MPTPKSGGESVKSVSAEAENAEEAAEAENAAEAAEAPPTRRNRLRVPGKR